MPIRVGLLTEGNDYLVLLAYLAKLLGVPEDEIEADFLDGTGRGHEFVKKNIDAALRRFYGKCAQLAIVSMDNDGNIDLDAAGLQEDPNHPRHWLHADGVPTVGCRWCLIHEAAETTRQSLNWIPTKPGDQWPIIIAIPVESIEAWLLMTQAVLSPEKESLRAERERRADYKSRFYGRPRATLEDVRNIALPMVRALGSDHLRRLREHSRSFSDFAEQVERRRDEILTAPPCW